VECLVYRLGKEAHPSRPSPQPARAVLYVSHQSSDQELRHESIIRQLLAEEPDSAFYTCDVRGIGESRPDTCNSSSYQDPYGSDYFYAVHALMLGRPYLGRKIQDVLTVLDWLKGIGHQGIHLAALGWGTLPAAFAAFLSDSVTRVTLKNAMPSFASIAESEFYQWPLSAFPPGVLRSFDLPDIYRELEKKKLRRMES
jgi:hypothetical protein